MRWVVGVTPRLPFSPGERTPGIHWAGGWVGPRFCLDTETRGKILFPLPGIETQSSDRPFRSQTLYWLSYPAPYSGTEPTVSPGYESVWGNGPVWTWWRKYEYCVFRKSNRRSPTHNHSRYNKTNKTWRPSGFSLLLLIPEVPGSKLVAEIVCLDGGFGCIPRSL
jgi:hypothetical protein